MPSRTMSFAFANALSTDPDAGVAEERCIASLGSQMAGVDPDLLVFFVSHHYGTHLEGLGRRLRDATGANCTVGCTGMSIVGGNREIENRPALSVWSATLPDTRLTATQLRAGQDQEDGAWNFHGVPEFKRPEQSGVLVLADPFSFPMAEYLSHMERVLPGAPVVGGMASGGRGPGQNLMFLDDKTIPSGGVMVTIEGATEICSSVSQGCRPVGQPLVITSCRDHLVLKLGGKGATRQLMRTIEALEEEERDLFRHGPFMGIAVDPSKSRFTSSDLLVRNIMGLHPQEEAVAVADTSIRVGQSVQFMVRDSDSASADLKQMLESHAQDWADPVERSPEAKEVGAFLFTCGGRGSHMFDTQHHDALQVQQSLGPDLPVAGFFANGEIGPVGGRNFLHGFSASIALLRRRR
ncbi:MAG: small ligand-binding sensory domain FIST [Planctomycetota bacterium]